MVTSYVRDRPVKAITTDLSDSGVSMSAINLLAPPPGTRVGLELMIPGVDDSIWAAGEICYRRNHELAAGLGVRFIAMARSQARLVRDFCIEARRTQLGSLLARIRA
jgi:c-di-GMP-binding flagellar brake protein YcgR